MLESASMLFLDRCDWRLEKIDIPVSFNHGSDSSIAPMHCAAKETRKLLENEGLVMVSGRTHALLTLYTGVVNQKLSKFLKSRYAI